MELHHLPLPASVKLIPLFIDAYLPGSGSPPSSGGPAGNSQSSGVSEKTPSGSSYLLRSGSKQSLAGKPVHEPFSEVLADHGKGRILSGSGSDLCGRFCDTQSPKGNRGTGMDAS